MDDGRETSVQSYIFLILICHSIEDYLLNIHQSIIDIISKILQFFLKKSINLTDRERKKFLFPYTKKKKTVSPLKEDAVLIFKHDWCVRQSIASF